MESEREATPELPETQGYQVLFSGVRFVVDEPHTEWDDDPHPQFRIDEDAAATYFAGTAAGKWNNAIGTASHQMIEQMNQIKNSIEKIGANKFKPFEYKDATDNANHPTGTDD